MQVLRILLKRNRIWTISAVITAMLSNHEKKGIIKPVKIDEKTGYRYYSAGQLQQVESLLALQDMGFTLSEIALIMSGNCSKEEMGALVEQKKTILNEENVRQILSEVIWL